MLSSPILDSRLEEWESENGGMTGWRRRWERVLVNSLVRVPRTRTLFCAGGPPQPHNPTAEERKYCFVSVLVVMTGPFVGRKRRRRPAPLRVHIVDDHCHALSKIHGAIRAGALPFSGLSILHFDAHPDLMVTPDMPASTCFHPEELYHTLATAEGGIAEWILPMVYQVGSYTSRSLPNSGGPDTSFLCAMR